MVGGIGDFDEAKISDIASKLSHAYWDGFGACVGHMIGMMTAIEADEHPEGERGVGYVKALEEVQDFLDGYID